MQKPKTAWLLNAKTEATFCLGSVHLIILDDSHWLSFSSYQLQIGLAARTHFLQHRDNLIIEVGQRLSVLLTYIRPEQGVFQWIWGFDPLFGSIHDSWSSESVRRFFSFYKIQLLQIYTVCFLNACTLSTLEEFGASKNRHDTCFLYF